MLVLEMFKIISFQMNKEFHSVERGHYIVR
jgi:hypothetical protein